MSKYLGKARKRRTAVTLNLAAMIDVVFLLLIFFMCANKWRTPEGSLPAHVPSGEGEQEEEVRPPERDLPFIRIRITGTGDRIAIRCQERTCADIAALTEHLVRLAGIDPAVPVVIDAEGTVSFRWVVRALNACLKADLDNVAFTAPGGGTPP